MINLTSFLTRLCDDVALIIAIQAITQADKQQILDDHNNYRANVATYGPPPATPLPALTWDDDLATVAENWVSNCIFQKNTERSQEYATIKGTKPNIEYVGA